MRYTVHNVDDEGRTCLFCDYALTTEYSLLSFALRSSVTSFVSRSAALGLWYRNADQADAAGDEFCCSSCVICFELRPYYTVPQTATLVKGAGADRIQAGCSDV